MDSPINIFVVDIDQILIKNHILDLFAKIFPKINRQIIGNETLKRITLRSFEIFEFFAMKIWLKYKTNEKLISFLNYQREEKDAHVFVVTDRSRLGINNVIKYLKPLGKDFIQIRAGIFKKRNSEILHGKDLEDSTTNICECPWIKPDIRVISKMVPSSQTLIIDDDAPFREVAKNHGYRVILGDYDRINDPEWFTLLLERRIKWMHNNASRA